MNLILWNRQHVDYKQKQHKKNEVWENVCAKLNLDVTTAKKKWKNFSDLYKKCLDRQQDTERSGAGASKPSRCTYFNDLVFLKDSISNRETSSNIDITIPPLNPSVTTPTSPYVTPSLSCASSFNTNTPCPGVRKQKRRDDDSRVEEMILNALCNEEKKKENEAPKYDEDEHYCPSLVPTSHVISKKKKLLFKSKVLTLLSELVDNDD